MKSTANATYRARRAPSPRMPARKSNSCAKRSPSVWIASKRRGAPPRALSRARQPLDALTAIEEQVEALQESVAEPVERRIPELANIASPGRLLKQRRPFRLGDRVRLRTLNAQGLVTALGEEEAEVQVGILRVRGRLADLPLFSEASLSDQPAPANRRKKRASDNSASSPPSSVSLHA